MHQFKDRTPDRYVRGFGGTTHAIYSPVGAPKPREETQPFTYTLDTTLEPWALRAQEKFLKQLATLTKKQERAAKKRRAMDNGTRQRGEMK